jgi:hypothetical protein
VTVTEVPVAEPVAIRVTRYRCPFCKRSSSRPAGIRPHIGMCWHNPAARACGTCRHRDQFDDYYGDHHFDCAAGRDVYVRPEPVPFDPIFDDPDETAREAGLRLVRNCPGWEPRP